MNVLVNGKRVMADIVNLNVEEGWVEIEDISILRDDLDLGIKPDIDPFLPHSVALPTKRLVGKVTFSE